MAEEFSSPLTVRVESVLEVKTGTEAAAKKLLIALLSQVDKSTSALASTILNFMKSRTELKMI